MDKFKFYNLSKDDKNKAKSFLKDDQIMVIVESFDDKIVLLNNRQILRPKNQSSMLMSRIRLNMKVKPCEGLFYFVHYISFLGQYKTDILTGNMLISELYKYNIDGIIYVQVSKEDTFG